MIEINFICLSKYTDTIEQTVLFDLFFVNPRTKDNGKNQLDKLLQICIRLVGIYYLVWPNFAGIPSNTFFCYLCLDWTHPWLLSIEWAFCVGYITTLSRQKIEQDRMSVPFNVFEFKKGLIIGLVFDELNVLHSIRQYSRTRSLVEATRA